MTSADHQGKRSPPPIGNGLGESVSRIGVIEVCDGTAPVRVELPVGWLA